MPQYSESCSVFGNSVMGADLKGGLSRCLVTAAVVLTRQQTTDDHVQDGDDEEVQQRRNDHPAEDRRAYRVSSRRSGAGRKYQRQHPEDKREGGHQDRTQSQAGAFGG